jgi:hypothetical protein
VGGIGGCTSTKPTAATVGGVAPYWQSYKYDLLGDRTSQTTHDPSGNTANNITQALTYRGGGTSPAAQPNIPNTITTTGPGGTTTTGVTANNDGQTTAQNGTTGWDLRSQRRIDVRRRRSRRWSRSPVPDPG